MGFLNRLGKFVGHVIYGTPTNFVVQWEVTIQTQPDAPAPYRGFVPVQAPQSATPTQLLEAAIRVVRMERPDLPAERHWWAWVNVKQCD